MIATICGESPPGGGADMREAFRIEPGTERGSDTQYSHTHTDQGVHA